MSLEDVGFTRVQEGLDRAREHEHMFLNDFDSQRVSIRFEKWEMWKHDPIHLYHASLLE